MVPGKSLQKAEELLKKEGYSSKPGNKYIQHKNPAHLPRLKATTDKTASIEIHLVAVELKYRDELTSAQIWMGKQYIPDFPDWRLAHGPGHFQIR